MMATYRPHNNPLMEWVQTRGRMRSQSDDGRNNLRGIVRKKKGKPFGLVSRPDYYP